MVLEPIQGEGGIVPIPVAFIRAARELCDRHQHSWFLTKSSLAVLRLDWSNAATKGVFTKVGAIALTVIPFSPTSRAKARVKPTTPAFEVT
jgi:hypothetical protein